MTLDALIDKQSVLASLKAPNKKQLLQELSQALATQVAIDHRVIFETLLKREKLGSTGIGQVRLGCPDPNRSSTPLTRSPVSLGFPNQPFSGGPPGTGSVGLTSPPRAASSIGMSASGYRMGRSDRLRESSAEEYCP